jgi:hypothetical protein
MVRVLADKSPTPLPMIVPAPVEQPVTVNTGQQQGGGIIDNLLRDLLGGGQ